MRFVVTGGAGFVGSHLVKLLLENGHDIIVIDNLHTGKKENLGSMIDKIEFRELDIRNHESMKNILKNIDGVFHQAALTVVQDSFSNPKEYHDVNVQGTENIFKLSIKNKFKVVYASSSSVYGHKQKMPIEESVERKPINPYGQTKLECEHLFEKYSKLGGSIIGLRYFNIFGKGQTIEYAGVITKFIERLKEGKAPMIFGEGSQIRDFISVDDVARANLMAMNYNESNLLVNIGSGKSISVLELANIMIKISGLGLSPIFTEALQGDIEKSHADISLAKRSFGWKPEIIIQEWLEEIIKK
jgi:UDP-glucose 4-epimerase